MFVFKHARLPDGLVLSAALDPVPRYVVKSELRRFAFSRLFLAGIGCLFVERFERTRSTEDARAITKALADGAEIGIFVEGTLHRMPGLLPFQLGAFRAAVEANATVVPVVLRGTRSVLRNESWFPAAGSFACGSGKRSIRAPSTPVCRSGSARCGCATLPGA